MLLEIHKVHVRNLRNQAQRFLRLGSEKRHREREYKLAWDQRKILIFKPLIGAKKKTENSPSDLSLCLSLVWHFHTNGSLPGLSWELGTEYYEMKWNQKSLGKETQFALVELQIWWTNASCCCCWRKWVHKMVVEKILVGVVVTKCEATLRFILEKLALFSPC